MNAIWIVTANAGRARFFSQADAAAPLEEFNDMINAGARLRTSETETDALGQHAASRSIHKVGAPRTPSGYEPDQSPAEHQTELFARNVADYLIQSKRDKRFSQFILATSPEFLGVLRKQLDPQLASVLSLEINKDYTQLDAGDLHDQIQVYKRKE